MDFAQLRMQLREGSKLLHLTKQPITHAARVWPKHLPEHFMKQSWSKPSQAGTAVTRINNTITVVTNFAIFKPSRTQQFFNFPSNFLIRGVGTRWILSYIYRRLASKVKGARADDECVINWVLISWLHETVKLKIWI